MTDDADSTPQDLPQDKTQDIPQDLPEDVPFALQDVDGNPIDELTFEDALEVAVMLHREGHIENAEQVYERILAVAPEHPGVLHYYGLLLYHTGRSSEGLPLIARSLEVDPTPADWLNNFGLIKLTQGEATQAIELFERAITMNPRHASAFNNLGLALRAIKNVTRSEDAFKRAIELEPDLADPYANYGNLLAAQKRTAEAMKNYSIAAIKSKNNILGDDLRMQASAYYVAGDFEKAAEVYRKWLAENPGSAVASHMLAATSGENIPARASDLYVKDVFDRFANTFDSKLNYLEYRAPEHVKAAIETFCGPPSKRLDCLDAGAGTGLCGPLISPWTRKLHAVDLSPAMLQIARGRGCYDTIEVAELTGYIGDHPDSYDLIVSADTLCYFGDLGEVAEVSSRALRPGGWLIFTVEQAKPSVDRYSLNPHGRYSHAESYVSDAMRKAAFAVVAIEHKTLRQEVGEPVAGLVVTAQRPPL